MKRLFVILITLFVNDSFAISPEKLQTDEELMVDWLHQVEDRLSSIESIERDLDSYKVILKRDLFNVSFARIILNIYSTGLVSVSSFFSFFFFAQSVEAEDIARVFCGGMSMGALGLATLTAYFMYRLNTKCNKRLAVDQRIIAKLDQMRASLQQTQHVE